MCTSQSEPMAGTQRVLLDAAAALDEAARDPTACSELDEEALQSVLAAVTRAYVARCRLGEPLNPYGGHAPTATEVAVIASAMLESAWIEPFELGLWRSWGAPAGRIGEDHG